MATLSRELNHTMMAKRTQNTSVTAVFEAIITAQGEESAPQELQH